MCCVLVRNILDMVPRLLQLKQIKHSSYYNFLIFNVFFFFDRFYLQLQIKCKIYGTDMKKMII